MQNNEEKIEVESRGSKKRLDAFLAAELDELSRSQWKALIESGGVLVNGAACKPNHKLKAGDTIEWTLPEAVSDEVLPEDVPLDILYEDAAVLVVNKPPGMVVHPAPGNMTGTLQNGLLAHDPAFLEVERAGIVHRLDKDTSGVMVVAKSEKAMAELQRQFKDRETDKEYAALVWGEPAQRGRIETQIGRHPVHRQKQAVLKEGGRVAISNYERLEQFEETTLMGVKIETGRTHQIRVHMAHLGHPIVGDGVYGRARKHRLPQKPERQMLHARKLAFTHPESGKRLSFEAPLASDMDTLLVKLRDSTE
jgi:23S rRNA pseudouridine1911/1915/1917 synthase